MVLLAALPLESSSSVSSLSPGVCSSMAANQRCAIQDLNRPIPPSLTSDQGGYLRLDSYGFEMEVDDDDEEEDFLGSSPTSSSSRSSPDNSSLSSFDLCPTIPENAYRRQMLDLSIIKMQTMNCRQPISLRRSVLIFNTMKYLQDELNRIESSPSTDGEYELDLSANESPLNDDQGGHWPSEHVYSQSWPWSNADDDVTMEEQEPPNHGCIGAEIVRSYEILNSRAATPGGFDPLNHQGLNEAEILATLGLTAANRSC